MDTPLHRFSASLPRAESSWRSGAAKGGPNCDFGRWGESAGGAALLSASAPHEAPVTVYRPAVASWYGPGLYGRTTACGQRMTRTLLGVAHKRLPCGTPVAVLYKGRRITVPVVDRGPFLPGTTWDLTVATAQALGFEHTDRVGAVRVAP